MLKYLLEALHYFPLKLKKFQKFPIVEFDFVDIYDRLGNQIISHPHLKLLDSKNSKEISKIYHEYALHLAAMQYGDWLKQYFNIPSKKICYWITPWGENKKEHKDFRLSYEYAEQYTKGLLKIRDTLRKNPYNPKKYGYPTAQVLINEKGEKRAIIWNGHRRILSMASLGYTRIPLEISGGNRWSKTNENHVINIQEIDTWKNIINNLYSKEEARTFFNTFFR